MKICLVGHFKNDLDEGVRNVGKSIYKQLKKIGMDTITIDITSISDWKKIKDFRPDIIHFILTPTLNGLIVAKIISILNYKSKIIISAIHPSVPKWRILRLLSPDLLLVQSKESEEFFKSIGFSTKFLYNGVDIHKFKPVTGTQKNELRDKYKIPNEKFVILHLASLKRERNLDIFKDIQKEENNQVVIVGRANEDRNDNLVSELEESGCFLWIKHFDNIEEVYNLSDCYVFPTVDKKACIETPLSILEAMACNLPVLTTNFGSIPSIFNNGQKGIIFEDDVKKFPKNINYLKSVLKIKNRDIILNYSWESVIKRLRKLYDELY